MAFPQLDLVSIAVPSNFSFEAATCVGGAWDELQGDIGSDWFWKRTDFDARQKKEGNGRVYLVPFVAPGDPAMALAPTNGLVQIQYAPGDEIQNSADPSNSSGVYKPGANQINCGLACAPEADQDLRTIVGFGKTNSPANHWAINVSLGDGSAGAKQLLIPGNYASFAFQITYRSLVPTTLAFEYRKLVAGNDEWLAPQGMALYIPTPAPKPRLFGQLARLRGIIGGGNAA